MSATTARPTKAQVLVIGGGPAGSYAAGVMAREGLDVVVFEQAKFPRYHIGESLLASCNEFFNFLGMKEKMANYGFVRKPGAAVKFNQHKREGYTDFISVDPTNGAFQVIRSEFDDLMLNHARELGAKVNENTEVTEIHFDANGKRPIAASWKSKADGIDGKIEFEWLVDCSGRNGIMSTRYDKTRNYNEALRNVAIWGYWDNVDKYGKGTTRENAIWVEALTDETGWSWLIPLHDGTHSVGVVMHQDANKAIRKNAPSQTAHYHERISKSPALAKMLENATLTKKHGGSTGIQQAADYSYSASSYAGDHYRIAGDAGAFIDPFFSSGVHLAFTGALSAAATICASIRGDVSESKAQEFHTRKIGVAFTRFLLVVLASYRQMRNQEMDVLSSVDQDNFDAAFKSIRPIIQGLSERELDDKLTEEELRDTMSFVVNVFASDPEQASEAIKDGKLEENLIKADKTTVEEVIAAVKSAADEEARSAVLWANARKPLTTVYNAPKNFREEEILGGVVRMEVGKLGIQSASA